MHLNILSIITHPLTNNWHQVSYLVATVESGFENINAQYRLRDSCHSLPGVPLSPEPYELLPSHQFDTESLADAFNTFNVREANLQDRGSVRYTVNQRPGD